MPTVHSAVWRPKERVYCIDGSDNRFPPLYGDNAPFSSGYDCLHPNCRHHLVPYFEDKESPNDFEKMRKESNKPFKDNRTSAEVKQYQRGQAYSRQLYQKLENKLRNEIEKLSNNTEKKAYQVDKKAVSVYNRLIDDKGNEAFDYPKSDAIQKLNSSEEIRDFFKYRDKYGTEYDPINESFSNLPLEAQKEAAEGILYAQEKFGVKELPYRIRVGKLTKAWGQYQTDDDGYTEIFIDPSVAYKKNAKEIFPTMVHEMTHYVDASNQHFSEEIVKTALKNLGLRANSRDAENLIYRTVGGQDYALNDKSEILAFAVEKVVINKSNKLADEIFKIFMESVSKNV